MHNQKNNYHETRIALLEQTITSIDRRFNSLEMNFKHIENKFDKKFDDINNRMWSNFLWLMAGMDGSAVTIIGIMAKGFKWI